MNLKTGKSVKVRKGILCPDDPEFDLSGWQGRIIEVSEDEDGEMTIGIAWDSLTLKEMPERYIESVLYIHAFVCKEDVLQEARTKERSDDDRTYYGKSTVPWRETRNPGDTNGG